MTEMHHRVKGVGLSSDKRLKEEAKSEGHDSDYEEEEYEGEIVRAVYEDKTFVLSSLP